MYKRLGGSDEHINAVPNFLDSDLFSSAEKAALRFAEAMTRDAHSIDDATWTALTDHFDNGEIIEIASVVGLFNYFNRWNDALQTAITR